MIISKCKKILDTKFGQCKTQTADWGYNLTVEKAQTHKIVLGLIRPKVSISKGFGLFQQLRYNLSLHFTPGMQSAVCSLRFTLTDTKLSLFCTFLHVSIHNLYDIHANNDSLWKNFACQTVYLDFFAFSSK